MTFSEILLEAFRSATGGSYVMVLFPSAEFIKKSNLPTGFSVGEGYVYLRTSVATTTLKSLIIDRLFIVNESMCDPLSVELAEQRTAGAFNPIIKRVSCERLN